MLLVSQLDAGRSQLLPTGQSTHRVAQIAPCLRHWGINQLLGQCDRCQFTTHYFLDERMTAKALKRDRDLYESGLLFDKC